MKFALALLLVSVAVAHAAFPQHPRFYHGDALDFAPNQYIVVLNQSATSEVLQNLVAHYPAFKTYEIFETFKGFAAKLSATELAFLLDEPFVEFVEPDQISYASLCLDRQPAASWGLDRVTAPGPNEINNNLHYNKNDGEGVNVYVIDTGILVTHDDFQNPTRAFWGYNAVAGSTDTDKNGHGTHVASTSVGNVYGFAKKANVYAVKVLGDNGSGTNSGVIDGVNWAANQKRSTGKPSVANMSLGGGLSTALDSAVNAAVNGGLLMAVAAGNDNSNACLASPARANQAITVGSTELSTAGGVQIDLRSSFSNHGSCVNIFAPGSAITAAWIGSNSAIRTISGTSMASPHVCGQIAVHLSENGSLTQDQMLALLQNQAQTGVINLNCGTNNNCAQSPNVFLHRANC